MSGIHVYVHVPFCVDACGYCDFYRGRHTHPAEGVYLRALIREMSLRLPEGRRVESLYFGGGTPSLLSIGTWETIFDELRRIAPIESGAEISIEANPAGITPARARAWKVLGVNRVSVGIQSLNNRILKFLNRLHTRAVALRALDILEDAGLENLNADLIYGIPGQTVGDLLDSVTTLAPRLSHLSAYALTIEPNTPFGRRGVPAAGSDDAAGEIASLAQAAETQGLIRYEISNFARSGRRCLHNLNTWRYGAYVGLGPSAVGFDGHRRYRNVPNLHRYVTALSKGELPEDSFETVSAAMAWEERLLLGLRTTGGVELGEDDRAAFRDQARAAGVENCFDWTASALRLNPASFMLMDEILSRIFAQDPVTA